MLYTISLPSSLDEFEGCQWVQLEKTLLLSTMANTVTTATWTHLELQENHPKFIWARQWPLPPSKLVRWQFFLAFGWTPPHSNPWFRILIPPPPWFMSNFIIHDFAPKYWTCLSCKSNNMTMHHHMWSSDILHFTLYYILFVLQTSNLFLNISYDLVFLKMCYIMWLWCHRTITHMIKIYRITKDGPSSCFTCETRPPCTTPSTHLCLCYPPLLHLTNLPHPPAQNPLLYYKNGLIIHIYSQFLIHLQNHSTLGLKLLIEVEWGDVWSQIVKESFYIDF